VCFTILTCKKDKKECVLSSEGRDGNMMFMVRFRCAIPCCRGLSLQEGKYDISLLGFAVLLPDVASYSIVLCFFDEERRRVIKVD
jgi:hypothetical protein